MIILLQFLLDFGSSLDLFTRANTYFLTLAVGVRSLWGSSHAQGKDPGSSRSCSGAEASFRHLGFLCSNPSLSMLAAIGTRVLTASSRQAATDRFRGARNASSDLNIDQCSFKEKKTPTIQVRQSLLLFFGGGCTLASLRRLTEVSAMAHNRAEFEVLMKHYVIYISSSWLAGRTFPGSIKDVFCLLQIFLLESAVSADVNNSPFQRC